MREKGFTLVELLGVIVILSLMVLILVPTVDKAIKSGKKSADTQLEENIILAARAWASDNKKDLPKLGIQKNVMLTFLQQQGYIDKKIQLPSTGDIFENACVQIKNVNKIYNYTYNRDCTVFMDLTIIGNRPASTWTNLPITLTAKSNYEGTYQWKQNGSNIAGATGKSYVANPVNGTETKINYNVDMAAEGKVFPAKNTFAAWLDKKAPSTGATVPTGWTSTNKNITITLTDGGIGTSAYYVGTTNTAPAAGATGWISNPLDGGVSGTATASKGVGTYYVFSKDKLNNISAGGAVSVTNIDTTAPSISASLTSYPSAASRTVLISLSDTGSGVAGYYMSTSNTKPLASAAGWTDFNVAAGTTGNATVTKTPGTYYIFAKDKVGNVSNAVAVTVVADTTPPTVSASISATIPSNTTRNIIINLSDAGSGVDGYYISTSSAKPAASAAGWTSFSLGSGQSGSATVAKTAGTYYIFAKDKVGNVSNAVSVVVVTDSIPPSCVWASGPTGTMVNGYVKNSQSLTYVLKCTDTSGFSDSSIAVADIESSNTGVATITSVSGASAISGGYQWTVTAKAGATTGTAQFRLKPSAVADALGNKNVVSGYSGVFKSDNTPPTITAGNNRGSGWVQSGTTVTVSGNYSDSMSGVNTGTLYYSYDASSQSGNDWASNTGSSYSATWSATRNNQVWVRIADKLGNYSGWVSAGYVRILSPNKSWVWYGGWAGPGPSYFYAEYQAREVEKSATQSHLQWRCLVYIPQGNFYGSWGTTNWGYNFNLYGAGSIVADSGWRDYGTPWRDYGVTFGDNCSAWYNASREYRSTAYASITPCATC